MNFFKKPVLVNTDSVQIEEFLSRSVENIFPNKEYVSKKLLSGKPLTFYFGIDPTGPTIHIGHIVPILHMKKLQQMGHKVILLIGDFTATIGDPDKLSARKPLTRKEVLNNLKNYKKQLSLFIDFKGSNKAEFVFNSTWLSKMTFEDVIGLASKMTVDQMLKRDMFRKRMEEGKPVFIHEFLYPLMQGYDSVQLDVDGEVGGNDQIFNMLAGRDLLKEIKNKDKVVIGTKLLTDPTGKKMGKSEGNMVMLSDTPYNVFGKVMSWPDSMIIPAFTHCTEVSLQKISEFEAKIAQGVNPRDLKIELAKEIVCMCFGAKESVLAEKVFIDTFSKKEMPSDAPTHECVSGTKLVDIVVEKGLVKSKSDFRRLLDEGALMDFESEEKIKDANFILEKSLSLKVGKHRFLKILVK